MPQEAWDDDLKGLSHSEQVARIQDEARAAGAELTEDQAVRVLEIYHSWPTTDSQTTQAIPRAVADEARELAQRRHTAGINSAADWIASGW